MAELIPELDVLIASIDWLWARGVKPLHVSIAKGSQAGRYEDRRRLEEALETAGIPRDSWSLSKDGPDIVAASAQECWQVECKGAGTGVQSTQRNNFDRALASVVSYYDNLPSVASPNCTGAGVLGLALPSTTDYMREINRRVSISLRQALNMWLLLYEPSQRAVNAIAPHESLDS